MKGDARLTGLREGDTFLLGGVEWRGGLWMLDADASLHAVGAPAPLGAQTGYTGALRLGWRGESFRVRAGAVGQWTHSTPEGVAAVAWLPSLHAGWRSGRFGLSAGVFDGLGYAPAHLSAHWDGYSLGFVAPLGARVGAEVPFGNGFGMRVEGFAFALGNYQSALLTVSATFDVAGNTAGQPAEALAP